MNLTQKAALIPDTDIPGLIVRQRQADSDSSDDESEPEVKIEISRPDWDMLELIMDMMQTEIGKGSSSEDMEIRMARDKMLYDMVTKLSHEDDTELMMKLEGTPGIRAHIRRVQNVLRWMNPKVIILS